MDPLVDTHCHLNFKVFEADLDQVLKRAWSNGIERIMLPGIDLKTSLQVIAMCERDPRLYAAVGVHPNDAVTWNDQTLNELRRLAQHPRVLAIGEIGLDYYRDRAPRDLQRQIFQAQLHLAADVAKPVLIHTRQSLPDAWPILRSWQQGLARKNSPLASRCGVVHSYDGDRATALEAIQAGFMIGISGPVTFPNAPERQRLVAGLPLTGIVLETDAPFLTPQPRRGQRNEPAYIAMIADKIAELHAQPRAVVAQVTSDNADRMLGWRSNR